MVKKQFSTHSYDRNKCLKSNLKISKSHQIQPKYTVYRLYAVYGILSISSCSHGHAHCKNLLYNSVKEYHYLYVLYERIRITKATKQNLSKFWIELFKVFVFQWVPIFDGFVLLIRRSRTGFVHLLGYHFQYCNIFSSFRQWSRDTTKLICPLLRRCRGRGWQRSIFQTGPLYISIRWNVNTSWKSSSGWTSYCDWWWPR